MDGISGLSLWISGSLIRTVGPEVVGLDGKVDGGGGGGGAGGIVRVVVAVVAGGSPATRFA